MSELKFKLESDDSKKLSIICGPVNSNLSKIEAAYFLFPVKIKTLQKVDSLLKSSLVSLTSQKTSLQKKSISLFPKL